MKNITAPSGSTQLASASVRIGAMLSAVAAHRPARAPNSRAVRRYISQVEPAKNRIDGSRTTSDASLWKRRIDSPTAQ